MEEKEVLEIKTREKKNKNLRKELKRNFNKKRKINVPSFVKNIIWIFVIIVVGIIMMLIGYKLSSSFETQTKTTKLGLKDVGELVTQTCYVTELQDNKENREFFKLFDIPFTESRQIFSYDFEVDASVNFEEIEYVTNDEKKEITITVPHAKIYKSTMKLESLKVYLDDESLFSNIDMTEEKDAQLQMEKQAIKDCKANGLLIKADENAIKLIEGVIKGNEQYQDYKVIIEYKKEK